MDKDKDSKDGKPPAKPDKLSFNQGIKDYLAGTMRKRGGPISDQSTYANPKKLKLDPEPSRSSILERPSTAPESARLFPAMPGRTSPTRTASLLILRTSWRLTAIPTHPSSTSPSILEPQSTPSAWAVPTDSKDKGKVADSETPARLGATPSGETTTDIVPASNNNRPTVHFFAFKDLSKDGEPTLRKEIGEIIIAGFNDEGAKDLYFGPDAPENEESRPDICWKTPRMFLPSPTRELVEGSAVTPYDVSCYIEQVITDNPLGKTSHSDERADRLAMGTVNVPDDQAFFFVAPQDLFVLEQAGKGCYDTSAVPWTHGVNNLLPFAHDRYFEFCSLKNFVWEWDATAK